MMEEAEGEVMNVETLRAKPARNDFAAVN